MNPCKIKFRGAYIDEGEFKTFVANYQTKTDSRVKGMPPAYIESLLSQVNDHFGFDEATHTYIYDPKGSGIKFSATTEVVNRDYQFRGTITKEGEFSRELGSRFHSIAEYVIKNRKKGRSLSNILKSTSIKLGNKDEKDFASWISNQYDEWTADGSIVMSEFKIGNTNAQLAGTVDIAIIHPDGSVSLKDFKGSRHEYNGDSRTKLASNNLQLNIYKKMLEYGDTRLGIPPLTVRDMFVIPLHYDIETDAAGNLFHTNFAIDHEISTGDRKVFDKFVMTGPQIADSIVNPEIIPTNLRVSGVPDFNLFFENITGHTYLNRKSKDELVDKMIQNLKKGPNGYWYYNHLGQIAQFRSKTALYDDGVDGMQARRQELLDTYAENVLKDSQNFAYQIIRAFNNKDYDIWQKDKAANQKSVTAKNAIVRSILSQYDQETDKLVKANSVKGLENLGDDVILVYRNYHLGDYTHIDMFSVNQNDSEIRVAKSGNNTNLYGEYFSDNTVRSVSHSLGIPPSQIFKNTHKSNMLMKMGIAVMQMKKTNPDLKVGGLSVYSISDADRKETTISETASLRRIFDNLKVMNALKDGDQSMSKRGGEELHELVSDPQLLDYRGFQQNELENYLNYISFHLSRTNSNASILADIPFKEQSKETIHHFMKEVNQDKAKRQSLITALMNRASEIENAYLDQNKTVSDISSSYIVDKEYRMIADTILQLKGIDLGTEIASDINLLETYGSTAAMTGMEILDKYQLEMKKAHDLASEELVHGYIPEKKGKFSELFGKNLTNNTLGFTTKFFDSLIEEQPFYTSEGKKVIRKTMRFWPKSSVEYQRLGETEKQFIDWFNSKMQDAYTMGMAPEEKEDFMTKKWPLMEGHIPLMKSSLSNILYRKGSDAINKKSRGSKNIVKSFLTNETNKYINHNDYFLELEDSHIDQIQHYFESQIPNDETYSPQYGDSIRRKRLGLTNDETPLAVEHDDLIETNLERVLDALYVGAVSKKHLEPMVPLYKSVRSVLLAAQYENQIKLPNALQLLKVYTESTLFNKRQTMHVDPRLEAGLDLLGKTTSSAAIAFNMYSGIKNFVANHLHQLVNEVARTASGEANWKESAKSYMDTWKWMANANYKDSNKLMSVMYSARLADVDLDNLRSSINFKVGGNHIFSSKYGWFMQYASDFFHRSWIAVRQMRVDGVWDAYEQVQGHEGTEWVYNQDKDPRWKKNPRLFQAVLKVMGEEGTLDSQGRMKYPYTSQEIASIKKVANQTFEPQTMSDNPILKSFTVGKMFSAMGGWLVAKRERWYKEGHTNEVYGKWTYELDEGGSPVPVWEGTYYEGMWQTMVVMAGTLQSMVKGEDKRTLRQAWGDLQPKQRENFGRLLSDIGIAAALGAAVGAMFGDDDEDEERRKKKTLLYRLMTGSIDEIFLFSNFASAKDTFFSPFPAVSIATDLVNNLLSFDPDKTAKGVLQWSGPLKLIPQTQQLIDEFNYWAEQELSE